MLEMTHDARRQLDHYLREMRATLRWCRSVDCDEVERDVLEHIEDSLAADDRPIDQSKLASVLRQLGSPVQWIPGDEFTWLLRARVAAIRCWGVITQEFRRLAGGPESLKLIYLSPLLLLIASVMTIELAETPAPYAVALFAFCASRAALAMRPPHDMQAHRWLVYPALLAVYVPIVVVLIAWTVVASFGLVDLYGMGVRRGHHPPLGLPWIPTWLVALFLVPTLTCVWWSCLSFVGWVWPAAVRAVFYPFGQTFTGKRCLWIGLLLGFCGMASVAFGIWFVVTLSASSSPTIVW